jgi:hypothetical protein
VTVVSPSAARNKGFASHINFLLGSVVSFALSAVASIAVTANAYAESSHPLRLGLVLLSLIFLHLIIVPKLWVSRELKIYLVFIGYMFLSLLWTQNVPLATDTLALANNCVLILLLYGALVVYHNRRAVFTGMLVGFLIAAAIYTLTQRFPFTYPDGFSYNSIAGMYLFGLFATIMFGWSTRRAVIPIAISLILLLLIAATTSIKTNLGIALGAGMAGLLYFRHFVRAMRKTLILFIVFSALIVMALNSNADLVERIDAGIDRVNLGIKALLAREDITANTTLGDRKRWQDEGLQGWVQNPILGYGVEEFRMDFGVTSHSTPVDLLYNSGLIGFGLFYGILISIGWRLHRALDSAGSGLRAFLSGLLICYVFISLSAPMYYEALLAVFVAISAAVLRPTPSEMRSGRTG